MSNRFPKSGLLAATLALTACATTPGPDSPVTIKLNELDQRTARLEKGMQNQASLVSQVQSLEGEVRELRGQIEELQHRFDGLSERQRNLYVDVDGRLQALESGGTGSTGVTPSPSAGTAAAAGSAAAVAQDGSATSSDRDAYQAAISLLRDGHYQEAAQAFGDFLNDYPGSQFSDNAQYWYGETFYVTRKFDEALAAFQKVVADYPQSQKVPDALLKIGYCDYELGYWDAARAALTRVTTDFSDTAAARLARLRLEQMTSEGH